MKLPQLTLVFTIILVGGGLRLTWLEIRPMHADEAIQADKFGSLLETGDYRYDPYNYHGPTLSYLTLPSAWLSGISRFPDLNETILRRVPALLGLLLVLLPFLLRDALTFPEASACAALTAVSPAMSYYSRYYIHEMLLTFFAGVVIICGFLYFRRPRLLWAVAGGASTGLMLATKETAIISIGSLLVAAILAACFQDKKAAIVRPAGNKESPVSPLLSRSPGIAVLIQHGVGFSLAALSVVVFFFTSRLKYPDGMKDFLAAFSNYFQRSAHDPLHVHPWHYYFHLLLFFKEAPGLFWSEAFIIVLALLGGWSILRKSSTDSSRVFVLRALLFYTILMTLAYAAIPYKTPWCLVGFLHGMILLAGVGSIGLVTSLWPTKSAWWAVSILLAGILHLFCQSLLANFKYYADPCNPYVYAHTSTDVFALRNKLEDLARISHEGHNLPLQIFSHTNLWPLPWYLRNFHRVQWWTQVPVNTPIAPVILATPEMETALVRRLYELPPPGQRELYLRLFNHYIELRPTVEVRGFIAKRFWDQVRDVGVD